MKQGDIGRKKKKNEKLSVRGPPLSYIELHYQQL